MADDEDPKAGELVTANYGWTKPTVGASDDQWGGYLNSDLDGIDTTVKSVSTVANAAYPASNPAGYITAAAIPAPYVLPTASTTVLGGVKVDGSTIAINSGVISAAGASITVSDTPPSSPSAGALWFNSSVGAGGGQLYVFYNDGNSSQWVPTTNQMGGGYATLAYVNSLPVIGDNRIINGDMRIDQRNNGASGTAASYTVDRWNFIPLQAGKGTWGRNLGGAVTIQTGFLYYLGFQSASAYTPLTGDTFLFTQLIEADMIGDCAFGQPNAQPLTLSFWVYSSLTGTFSGALYNYPSPPTRSYPFAYSIPVANVWTRIVITIPGDTAGAWVLSGAAAWGGVRFDLGSGATYRSTAGSWQSGNFVGVNGAVNVVATNGAFFLLTGVKLEIGSVATPYNRQSLAKSMADCQRYYQTVSQSVRGYGTSVSVVITCSVGWPAMRATPTTTLLIAGTRGNVAGVTFLSYLPNTGSFNAQCTAIGDTYALNDQWSLSAEL